MGRQPGNVGPTAETGRRAAFGLTMARLSAAAAASVGAALATANVDDFPMNEIDVQHLPIGT